MLEWKDLLALKLEVKDCVHGNTYNTGRNIQTHPVYTSGYGELD